MQRKLIKQGKGGLTIYVPKKWADKKGLKEGDELTVTETETSLVLSSGIKQQKEITIKIDGQTRQSISPIITHLYRRGYDTITITEINKGIFEEIKITTRDLLLGFDITYHDHASCTISNISEPMDEKYDVLVKRLFFIIKETSQIITQNFEENVFDALKDVSDLKVQHDKFSLFCKRILSKEKSPNPVTMWELLTFLMHIQHGFYYLYLYASGKKLRKNKHILELLHALKNYFQLFLDAFFKKDVVAIHSINAQKNIYTFGKCYQYLEKATGADAVIISHIREVFRIIQIGSSPILIEILEKNINLL